MTDPVRDPVRDLEDITVARVLEALTDCRLVRYDAVNRAWWGGRPVAGELVELAIHRRLGRAR